MKRSYYMRCPECDSLVLWGIAKSGNYAVMCDRDHCIVKGETKEAPYILDALELLSNKPKF